VPELAALTDQARLGHVARLRRPSESADLPGLPPLPRLARVLSRSGHLGPLRPTSPRHLAVLALLPDLSRPTWLPGISGLTQRAGLTRLFQDRRPG
jgi:hypothetical protein